MASAGSSDSLDTQPEVQWPELRAGTPRTTAGTRGCLGSRRALHLFLDECRVVMMK